MDTTEYLQTPSAGQDQAPLLHYGAAKTEARVAPDSRARLHILIASAAEAAGVSVILSDYFFLYENFIDFLPMNKYH